MPVAEVNDHRLLYERRGEGPPLLLIMGMAGTALHWHPVFLEALGAGRELILVDNRGVAAGERVADAFTTADLAGDMAGLLGELGIEAADVVGISLGGMIAQELAINHPERVHGLVLGCTWAGGATAVPLPQADIEDLGRLAVAMAGKDVTEIERLFWSLNFSADFAERDDERARMDAVNGERRVALSLIQMQLQAIALHDTADRLGGIEAPTLVIHGTADRMVAAGNAEVIASRIPGARLELLEGVGHLFFWERPEESAALIAGHLG